MTVLGQDVGISLLNEQDLMKKLDKNILSDERISILIAVRSPTKKRLKFNPLNAELNPICCLLALLGVHHFLHVSRIRVKSLTLRQLMSYIYIYIYIYGAPILDVSRSHTTTHHSR